MSCISDRGAEVADELARLQHEFATVMDNPFGSAEFMQRYVDDLERRIAVLEQQLRIASELLSRS